ncbi:hypothetical protein ACOSQ4_009905 [Xanthoceras sorbifolium]
MGFSVRGWSNVAGNGLIILLKAQGLQILGDLIETSIRLRNEINELFETCISFGSIFCICGFLTGNEFMNFAMKFGRQFGTVSMDETAL